MPDSSAPLTRITLGAMLGGLMGLAGFVLLPLTIEKADPMLRWGVLLWYPTLGSVIGALLRDPIDRLPRWASGGLVGGWMNMVLVFFAHREMERVMLTVFGSDGAFTSPFWFVLEGAIVGAAIGLVIDRVGTD